MLINTVVEFLGNHWILSSTFLILLVAFLANEWINRTVGVQTLEPKAAIDAINHSNAKILDIRQQTSFLEGHILGSLHIPMVHLEQKWKSLQSHQDKPIIVVCNMGQEATRASALLKQQGFTKVFVLNGGLQAWRAAGLPLTKKS